MNDGVPELAGPITSSNSIFFFLAKEFVDKKSIFNSNPHDATIYYLLHFIIYL